MRGKKWNHFVSWLVKWNEELERVGCLSGVLGKNNYNSSHMGM